MDKINSRGISDAKIWAAFRGETIQRSKVIMFHAGWTSTIAMAYFIWQDFTVLHLPYILPWRLLATIPSILLLLCSIFLKKQDWWVDPLFIFYKFGAVAMMTGILAVTNYFPASVPGAMAAMIIMMLMVQYGWKESIFVLALPVLALTGYSAMVYPDVNHWLPLIANLMVIVFVGIPVNQVQFSLKFSEFKSRFLLEAAHKELEKIDNAKDEFLSIVTHDLKSPLTSTIGYVDIILDGIDGQINEKQREHLTSVKRQGKTLQILIESILDYTRSEFGRIKVNKEKIDLNEQISETVKGIKIQMDAKKLKFDLKLPTEKLVINADRQMITRIITNLVVNAVKYTDVGGKIDLKLEKENGQAKIIVKDTGIGISKDQMSRLFEKFYMVDKKIERANNSLGLGLYIVKSFIEANGGSILVDSEGEGKGSTFTAALPLSA